jgi:methionine-S-sulfoxide reductase
MAGCKKGRINMKSEAVSIVLGGGCFWCIEAVFLMLDGVVKTTVGYAGGTTSNPTYESVCSGDTGHAEVMKLEYDPKVLPLSKIMDVFFTMHDPTSLNRQGADLGTQYRSIALCTSDEQKNAVEKFINAAQKEYTKIIVTEVKTLDKFYPAEEYHQHYFEKNPHAGYCQFVVKPKVDKVKKEFRL